jgi:hypothetical protein
MKIMNPTAIISNIMPEPGKPYSVSFDFDTPFEVNPLPQSFATAQEAFDSLSVGVIVYVRILPEGKKLRCRNGKLIG